MNSAGQEHRTAGRGWAVESFEWESDLERVLELWSLAGDGIQLSSSDQPAELRVKLQRDADLFLVVRQDERLIGTVLGGFDGRRGMIYHLAVDPEFRRRGVGRALMDELELRLAAKGCLKYYLLVTNDNEEAQAFYQDLGCERMNLRVYGKRLA